MFIYKNEFNREVTSLISSTLQRQQLWHLKCGIFSAAVYSVALVAVTLLCQQQLAAVFRPSLFSAPNSAAKKVKSQRKISSM